MRLTLPLAMIMATSALAADSTARLTIDLTTAGRVVSPMMHGVFKGGNFV